MVSILFCFLQDYLPKFVEAIWQLLVSTEKIAKHDLVSDNG